MRLLKQILALIVLALMCAPVFLIEDAEAAIVCGSQGHVLTLLQNNAGWRARDVKFYVNNEPLAQVYFHLAELVGLNFSVSDKVTIVVKNHLLSGNIADVLDKLSNDYAVTWFIDSNIVHIAPVSDNHTQAVSSGKLDERSFCQNLRQQGIDGTGQRLVVDEKGSRVEITGSQDFIAAVSDQLIPEVIDDKKKEGNDTTISVVRFGKLFTEN